nr:MAG TPA: hypothetical protein [Caudoviricetes sp.]
MRRKSFVYSGLRGGVKKGTGNSRRFFLYMSFTWALQKWGYKCLFGPQIFT